MKSLTGSKHGVEERKTSNKREYNTAEATSQIQEVEEELEATP